MYKKTPAICLKKTNYTQTDALISCFTAKFGKDDFLARGLRKPKAKLKSALFPLRGINLTFVNGKQFPVVTGAETKIELEALEASFNFHALGLFWAEIVDLAFVEPNPNPDFFNNFLQSLQTLNQEAKENKKITVRSKWINVWLIIKLLSSSGYGFQLEHCVSCNKEITAVDRCNFSSPKGGILCSDCEGADQLSLSNKTRKTLTKLKKSKTPNFSLPSQERLKEAQKLTLSFLYYQLNTKPATHALLDW